jgi:hypothetical protein
MHFKGIMAFVGAGMLTLALSTTSFAGVCIDDDSDGVCAPVDNCTGTPNPGQRDDDLDGMGNICDPDLNQDCVVGGADTSFIGAHWLQGPVWLPNPVGNGTTGAFDISEDNVIGGADTSFIGARWLKAPGPSGYGCAGWCNQFPAPPSQNAPFPVSCP